MASLDLALLIAFGSLFIISLTSSVFCFRKALKVSNEKDGDLKMFLWASGTMLSVIVAGMSAAYFLLPLFFYYH